MLNSKRLIWKGVTLPLSCRISSSVGTLSRSNSLTSLARKGTINRSDLGWIVSGTLSSPFGLVVIGSSSLILTPRFTASILINSRSRTRCSCNRTTASSSNTLQCTPRYPEKVQRIFLNLHCSLRHLSRNSTTGAIKSCQHLLHIAFPLQPQSLSSSWALISKSKFNSAL